jgi:hypothetical protein
MCFAMDNSTRYIFIVRIETFLHGIRIDLCELRHGFLKSRQLTDFGLMCDSAFDFLIIGLDPDSTTSYFPISRPVRPQGKGSEKETQVGTVPDKKSQRSPNTNQWDSLINQEVRKAVITGLGHFASGSALESLLYVMEQEYSVDFYAIADNPKVFRSGLSGMFGSADRIIETRICQALGSQFQTDSEGRSLEDLISILKTFEPKH